MRSFNPPLKKRLPIRPSGGLQMIEVWADIRMICRCTGLSERQVEGLKKLSK